MKAAETDDTSVVATGKKVVYWRRELPPLDAEAQGNYIVEATSLRVRNDLEHRDELWHRCYEDLMLNVQKRLDQEITRVGGDCAHVLDESVDSRHDDRTGETWLHGVFRYVLYRLRK
jgi:hypothetical protein